MGVSRPVVTAERRALRSVVPARRRRRCSSLRRRPHPTADAMPSPPPVPAATRANHESPRHVVVPGSWGALPPRPGGTPHTPNFMTIHHTALFSVTTPTRPLGSVTPALSPGHPGLDRHRVSLQRRSQWKHLPAERSQPRWRHRNKLRPHRPLPRRLRGKLRRGRSVGSAAQRRRARLRLGGSAIQHPDREAGGTPGCERRHRLPGRQPLRPRHVRRPQRSRRRHLGRRSGRTYISLWAEADAWSQTSRPASAET